MSTASIALAFAGKDLKVARSYRAPFLLSVVSTFMTLVTFKFIADLVSGTKAGAVTGDYFGFVVVGMALSQVLDGALSGPTGSARAEQVTGTLEVLASQPVSTTTLALGWAAYPVLQALVVGTIMIGLAGPLGFHLASDPNWLGAVLGMILAAIAFAGLGILGAAFVLTFQQGGSITQWVTGGLSLMSGVFFPLTLLPVLVQRLALASPLTHALGAVRGSLLAGKSLQGVAGDLAALAGFAAVLLPLSIASLGLALRRARAKGTLSTY